MSASALYGAVALDAGAAGAALSAPALPLLEVGDVTGRDPRVVRAELRGYDERRGQLAEQQRLLRAQAQIDAVNEPPAWVEPTIGPRPSDEHRALGDWKNAIRYVTDAQLHIDPSRPLDAGLPEAPERGEHLATWRRAEQAINTANRRLPRDVGRDLTDGLGR